MNTPSQPRRSPPKRGPNSRLTELLKIEHPIILSPMDAFCTAELAAAVCSAGGLGSIGCARDPWHADEKVRGLRKLTSRPINVNFFCHPRPKNDVIRDDLWREQLEPYFREAMVEVPPRVTSTFAPPFDDVACAIVEATRPEVVSFHFG